MKNYIRSLVLMSFIAAFNFELMADENSDKAKAAAAAKEISSATEYKFNKLLTPPHFQMYEAPRNGAYINKEGLVDTELDLTPEGFAELLYKKLDSCKPSNIASDISDFSQYSNKRNLKQPHFEESKNIKTDIISELNKKINKAQSKAKNDDNKDGTQDAAFWNQSKILIPDLKK